MATSTSKDVSHIVKFDGTNFSSWKFGIWMFLEKHKLIQVVEGTETKPAEVIQTVVHMHTHPLSVMRVPHNVTHVIESTLIQ